MSLQYTLSCSAEILEKEYSIDPTEGYKPTYNAAPTHLLPVITSENPKGFSFFYWGAIPKMANDKSISSKLVAAFSEDLMSKASYRNALMSRRCVVPMDGYYEWKRVSKKGKTPYWVHMPEHAVFNVAGFWDEFEDEEGENHHTFQLVTVPNNLLIDKSNQEMPAVLGQDDVSTWLDSNTGIDDLLPILKSFPSSQLESHSVSPKVNNPQVNSEDLIKHVPPADQFGNYALFT